MCSLRSSAPVDRRDTTIVDACVRVAEVSFYAYAEPCDATRLAELDAALHTQTGGRPEWRRVFVQFSGDCHGHLTIDIPKAAAEELVASFVGLADTPLTEAETADGLGEFANMVCGAFLTDAGHRLDFALTKPEVLAEPAAWSPLAALAATAGEGTAYALAINDWPMILRVDLEVRL